MKLTNIMQFILSFLIVIAPLTPQGVPQQAEAAVAAGTQWYIWQNATANNANGCGYDSTVASAGTNWANQQNAQYNLTGGTSIGAGTTILHASASADMVGNIAHVSGTNTTSGWYEIISQVTGVSLTTDRAVTTGAGAAMAVNIGGACSLGSATANFTDDLLFETSAAGNKWWIKYSATAYVPTAVSVSAVCTLNAPCMMLGFNATPGDNPLTVATQPTINNAGNAWAVTGAAWEMHFMNFTPTNAAGISTSSNGAKFTYNHCTNKSTTVNRTCITTNASNVLFLNNEVVSYRGVGIIETAGAATFVGNYVHDSDVCFSLTGGNISHFFYNNIIENCTTDNVTETTTAHAISQTFAFFNNTILGTPDHTNAAVGINLLTGASGVRLLGNIFNGFSNTAVVQADTGTGLYEDYNDFYNNGADVSGFTKNAWGHDVAVDPVFKSWVIVKGTTGTSSGSTLTQSGGTFPTFVPGSDFLHVVSASSATVGVYGIVSNTSSTIVTDLALGTNASADITYFIVYGHDFRIGVPLKAIGAPTNFPNSGTTLTTQFLDIGAAQRREPKPQRTH